MGSVWESTLSKVRIDGVNPATATVYIDDKKMGGIISLSYSMASGPDVELGICKIEMYVKGFGSDGFPILVEYADYPETWGSSDAEIKA